MVNLGPVRSGEVTLRPSPGCPGSPGSPGIPGCVPVCGEWRSFTFSSTFPTKVSSFGIAHVSPKMATVKADAIATVRLYRLISITSLPRKDPYISIITFLPCFLVGCFFSNPQPYAPQQCFTPIAGFIAWKHLERILLQTMQLFGKSQRESQVRFLLQTCCRNGHPCPSWFKTGKAFWVTTQILNPQLKYFPLL